MFINRGNQRTIVGFSSSNLNVYLIIVDYIYGVNFFLTPVQEKGMEKNIFGFISNYYYEKAFVYNNLNMAF